MDRAPEVSTAPEEEQPPYGPREPQRLGARVPPALRIGPTLTSFLLGAVLAGFLGWLVLAFGTQMVKSHAVQIKEVRLQASEEAYLAEYERAYDAALSQQITRELARMVLETDAGAGSAWAEGVRRGWAEGWNDALDAMRAASVEAGLDANSSEMAALNDVRHRHEDP